MTEYIELNTLEDIKKLPEGFFFARDSFGFLSHNCVKTDEERYYNAIAILVNNKLENGKPYRARDTADAFLIALRMFPRHQLTSKVFEACEYFYDGDDIAHPFFYTAGIFTIPKEKLNFKDMQLEFLTSCGRFIENFFLNMHGAAHGYPKKEQKEKVGTK
jgi:hypothetical protein